LTELFDPFSLEGDPFPAFAKARASGGILPGVPPYANLGPTVYLFTHRLVELALKHPRLLHSPPGDYRLIADSIEPGQHLVGVLNRSLLMADPPRHGVLRRPLNPSMRPADASALAAWIRDQAMTMAARIAAGGRFDTVQDFAIPFTLRVLGRVLGIAVPDTDMVRTATDAMARVIDIHRTSGAHEEAYALEACIEGEIAAGKVSPGGLVSTMLAQEQAGLWTREDRVANVLLFLFAGHETVVDTFGNAVMELDANPAQRALLEESRIGWMAAADELLRIGAPVHYAAVRIAAEDIDLDGTAIRAGTAVVPVMTSANRDTAVWPAGDELRLDAPGSAGSTFSAGIHSCIGQHLARSELASMLEALFAAAPGWKLDRGAVRRRDSLVFRGLTSAPVTVSLD
jgi:cytochrome P450 family 109